MTHRPLRLSLHGPDRANPRVARALTQLLHRSGIPELLLAEASEVALAWGAPPPPTVPALVLPWRGVLDPAADWQREARALAAASRRARTIGALREALFTPTATGAEAGIDLAAACLALLDEWEAATTARRDDHGRFPAAHALLFHEQVLNQPVVDRVARALGEELRRLAGLPPGPAPPAWAFCPTFDIDSDGMFRGRAALRTLRQAARMGAPTLGRVIARAGATTLQLRRDPHLCLASLARQFEGLGRRTTFFCQTHRAHRLDSYALRRNRPLQRELLGVLAAGMELGLHSSYATPQGRPSLDDQWARLPAGHARVHRAHYLRETGHDAWRADRDLVDSTLGYAGACGFRLGTCTPFRLAREAAGIAEGAIEAPPCAMDVTLRHREGLDPDQSFERVRLLCEHAAEVGGVAVLIWHPHNLEECLWPGWSDVLHDLVADALRRGARLDAIGTIAREFAARHDHLAKAVSAHLKP